jgi:hypothetical protein
VLLGVAALSILIVVPEPYLLTSWSVLAAVAVIERPGALRPFGRSRELVRGNRWRVLVLMFALTILVSAAGAVERSASVAANPLGVVAGLVVVALIAPAPVLATTVLYFELRGAVPAHGPADRIPPDAVPT